MTYSGLFDECKKEEEQIRKLKAENKRLKEIDKEHQKLNGKLHLEIEKLKKIILCYKKVTKLWVCIEMRMKFI